MYLGFHFDDDEVLSIIDITAGSHSCPTDQYLSQRSMEGGCEQEGHCDSSMGSLTFYGELSDDDRLALALLDAERDLRCGYSSSVTGAHWVDANAAVILFGSQAWFGDASYFPTIEAARQAFTEFSEDYEATVILGHLDSLGTLSPVAWRLKPTDVIDRIRAERAFTDEEWEAIVDAAWESEGS